MDVRMERARNGFSDRDTVTRRSMSILDDINDEKENIIPRQVRNKSNRLPLGSINSTTSPINTFQPVNNIKMKTAVPMGSNSSQHTFMPIRHSSVS